MTRIAITPAFVLAAATAASFATTGADASALPVVSRDLVGSILSGILSTSQAILTGSLQLGSSSTTTSCSSGNTVALTGSGSHNVAGTVQNSGSIFFGQQASASGSMSSSWSAGSLTNNAGATWKLNDYNGTSGSSYSWTLGSMVNSGLLQWCSTGSGSYSLKCSSSTCTNNGNIVFEQGSSCGWANTAQASGLSQSITHNGCMMLRSSSFTATQNYLGTGCWSIDAGSQLWFNAGTGSKNIASGSKCLNGHSINFPAGSSGGTLRLDTDVYSNFGASIYGFGTKSTLQFPDNIYSISYSGSTLTVNFGTFYTTQSMTLNVGSGYSGKWSFSNPLLSGYSAITYSGTVPSNSAPSTCSPSVSACGASAPSVPVASSSSASSTASSTSTSASSTSTSTSATATSTLSTSSATSAATSPTATSASSSYSTTASSSTSSSSSSSASSTPTINGASFDYGGVSYPGCFYDAAGSGGARTFSGPSTSSTTGMTNEYCANYCGKQSYKYSATEYSSECYCSNTAPTNTTGATCNMPCAGNSAETCGGSWSMTVFNNAQFPAAGSQLASNYATYGSGCYADSVSSRTFSAYSYSSPNMTIESCAATCSSKGHAFSGTEYSTECYCSDSIPGATSSSCNMQCGGAGYETCGGPGALSVVVDNSIAHSTTPTCANLPSGWAVCQEGQKVQNGQCVSA